MHQFGSGISFNVKLTYVRLFFMKYLLLLLLSFKSYAALEGRWLGVAGILLTDGQTTLLFDPVVTKPTFKHWFMNAELVSDEARVRERLAQWGVGQAQGLFVSHTHFDHASDVGMVAKLTGAVTHGGPSLQRVLKYQAPAAAFVSVKHKDYAQIGQFRIHFVERRHAPIIQALNFDFLPGPIPANFAGKFWDFHVGETWSFYVEHPDGNTLIDQGSRFIEDFRPWAGKIRTYFMGVANKKSLQSMMDENMGILKPQMVIPVHFDVFFWQSETMEQWVMPRMELDEIAEGIKKQHPTIRYHLPRAGEKITL